MFIIPIAVCVFIIARYKRIGAFAFATLTILTPVIAMILNILGISPPPSSIVYILTFILSLGVPLLIYVFIHFSPPSWTPSEIDSHSNKFTTKQAGSSYIALTGMSILLAGFFIFQVKTNASYYQHLWFYLYLVLKSITYSSVVMVFVLSIIRAMKNDLFPREAPTVQLVAIISFYLSMICGSLWANYAFGRYWGWEPKETWSLIMLYAMFAFHTAIVCRVPKRATMLLFSCVQMGLAVFVSYIIPLLIPSLWGFN